MSSIEIKVKSESIKGLQVQLNRSGGIPKQIQAAVTYVVGRELRRVRKELVKDIGRTEGLKARFLRGQNPRIIYGKRGQRVRNQKAMTGIHIARDGTSLHKGVLWFITENWRMDGLGVGKRLRRLKRGEKKYRVFAEKGRVLTKRKLAPQKSFLIKNRIYHRPAKKLERVKAPTSPTFIDSWKTAASIVGGIGFKRKMDREINRRIDIYVSKTINNV